MSPAEALPRPAVRCAVYTRGAGPGEPRRVSDSPSVQREAALAFIASRRHEGWSALAERYDEGFSPGGLDRPALRRLLAHARGARMECVVVYQADRLSRSLPELAVLVETFQTYGVGVISITEPLNTLESPRSALSSLLASFARFERGLMAERSGEAVRAARRQGRWVGGAPVLGYDLDRARRRLVVNDEEAERVRAIFALYLERKDGPAVVAELGRRGWRTKRHRSARGTVHGGRPFTKSTLHRLLRSPVYIGKVHFDGALRPGEHEAIVDETLWRRVQALRRRNALARSKVERNRHGGLLKGLLVCEACGTVMRHTSLGAARGRLVRYYSCVDDHLHIRAGCPTRSVRAHELETAFLRHLGSLAPAARQARERNAGRTQELERARGELLGRLRRLAAERRGHVQFLEWSLARGGGGTGPQAQLAEALRDAEARARPLRARLVALHRQSVD
ncbi:MAG: recombinase family protein, partial [bacterium]